MPDFMYLWSCSWNHILSAILPFYVAGSDVHPCNLAFKNLWHPSLLLVAYPCACSKGWLQGLHPFCLHHVFPQVAPTVLVSYANPHESPAPLHVAIIFPSHADLSDSYSPCQDTCVSIPLYTLTSLLIPGYCCIPLKKAKIPNWFAIFVSLLQIYWELLPGLKVGWWTISWEITQIFAISTAAVSFQIFQNKMLMLHTNGITMNNACPATRKQKPLIIEWDNCAE